MYKSLLVTVDGSEPSNDAIAAAAKLAKDFGAGLTLLHAPMSYTDVMPVGYAATTIPPTMEQIEKAGQGVLDKAKALAAENGMADVKAEMVFGEPAKVIVDYADKNGVDLIVMGRRGLGKIAGLLIGSVTSKVQQLAPCAVLTVK